MRKIVLLCSVLLIAIAAISIKYFSEISQNSDNLEKALNQIPADAALVLNFVNNETFQEIFSDYELFDAIIGKTRASEIGQLESLLFQPELIEASSDKNIFISFHPNKADSIDFLYTISLNADIPLKKVEQILFSLKDLTIAKTKAEDIYSLTFKSLKRPFFLYLKNDVALGSFSESLITRCLDKNSPKLEKVFIEEIVNLSSKNENSPVNLFINHNQIHNFVSHFLRGKTTGNTNLLTNIKGLSSLNMNFKSDALMFNGISRPDTTSISYLNLFLNQKPVSNDLKKVLPENTANFIAFAFSNYTLFKSKLDGYFHKKNELKKLQNQVKLIKERSAVDIDKDIKPFLGNEISIVETAARQKLGIIKVANVRRLKLSLSLIGTKVDENISQLNDSYIPYYFFGEPFKSFVRPFFSIIDNYLVVANTRDAIYNYLSLYHNGRFLIKTPEFSAFNQLVANQSNIFFFLNNANSERIIKNDLKRKFAEAFNDDNYGLKNFYGFSYQWSADKDHFFTNIYVNYLSKSTHELKEAWKFKIDGSLASPPTIVQGEEGKIVLIQDIQNNVFAISPEGKELWGTYLQGRVRGAFHLLDDGTILFNTHNKLYRKDLSGKDVDGFPVNLPFNASYGLSLSSSDPQQLKIFIPAGNVIMGFDKDGNSLENWNKSLEGKILSDIKTLTIENIHYLVAGTEIGYFYFFNQNGNLISKLRVEDTRFNSPIYLEAGSDSKTSKIITADTAGILTQVSFDGNVSQKKLADVSGKFFFDYKNVLGDEKPELMYLDRLGLNVFTTDGVPAYTYNFKEALNSRILFLKLNPYKFQIGISNPDKKELLLFNEDGTIDKSFPIKGKGYFILDDLKNNKKRYMIGSGSGGFLYAWELE